MSNYYLKPQMLITFLQKLPNSWGFCTETSLVEMINSGWTDEQSPKSVAAKSLISVTSFGNQTKEQDDHPHLLPFLLLHCLCVSIASPWHWTQPQKYCVMDEDIKRKSRRSIDVVAHPKPNSSLPSSYPCCPDAEHAPQHEDYNDNNSRAFFFSASH